MGRNCKKKKMGLRDLSGSTRPGLKGNELFRAGVGPATICLHVMFSGCVSVEAPQPWGSAALCTHPHCIPHTAHGTPYTAADTTPDRAKPRHAMQRRPTHTVHVDSAHLRLNCRHFCQQRCSIIEVDMADVGTQHLHNLFDLCCRSDGAQPVIWPKFVPSENGDIVASHDAPTHS